MDKKILGLLGLATAGGRIAPGDTAVRDAIFRGKAQLVVLARDCGENTKEKFVRLCSEKEITCIEMFDKETIGKAIGKEGKAVIALTDRGFAEAVMKYTAK